MNRVLWVCDVPDWAYDINAKVLAKNMPQYEHHYGYINNKNHLLTTMKDFDTGTVIVIMYPSGLRLCKKLSNVVSILDSVRALDTTERIELSCVTGIICCNEFLFNAVKNINKNVILQPNGVDLKEYSTPKNFDVFPDKFVVGFAANIAGGNGEYKGWSFYQKAVQSLGEGIVQLNAIRGPNQIPSNKMVSDFYQKINCLVLASINEGCSNVITEALACGVPVICTKVGYHGEALTEHEQCIFVERNAESIRGAILKLVNNPHLYLYMRCRAREFAVQNHDIKMVAATYMKVFQQILDSNLCRN